MEDKIKRVNDLINQYYVKFGKFFPVSLITRPSDDEIIKNIETSLKTGKPYIEPEVKIVEGRTY
jgi:threonyl-tRNA synthetase